MNLMNFVQNYYVLKPTGVLKFL